MPEVRLIDGNRLAEIFDSAADKAAGVLAMVYRDAAHFARTAPTIEPEVRHGHWVECDYKHLEHGFMETEPNAGLCCSECGTGFKKNHMTYKAFCPACGAKMDGGADNG